MRRGRPGWLAALLAASALAACGHLPTAQAPLELPADCAPQGPEALAALDETSLEPALRCALHHLRSDPALAQRHGPRTSALLAERLPPGERRELIAAEGARFGEGSKDPVIRYWIAVNLGVAVEAHPTRALRQLTILRDHLEAAAADAPATHHGGPLRVLGMLYLRAPAWPDGIGDGDKALALLERAATQHPEHPLNALFHATALHEIEGDPAGARDRLTAFDAALKDPRWAALRGDWSARAATLRAELE